MEAVEKQDPAERSSQDESTLTVVLAFGANLLIAVAKSVAALVTGSASMVAEAAHSWADSGNEVLLLIANRRSRRAPDEEHPLGFGREAYVWSMFAALGLFTAGAVVSIMHGVQELIDPEPASDFLVAYVVLALAFVLEGTSFIQALRQTRREARRAEEEVFAYALETSDPTLRAVFAEDAAALIGIVVAVTGIVLHQVTGSTVPDAIGSILIGILLGVVAIVLIDRNRRFLVGEAASPRTRKNALALLHSLPRVTRVTYLHLEYAGPRQLLLVARVDLEGDEVESSIAHRLRALEAQVEEHPSIVECVLTPARPEGTDLVS